MANKKLPDEAKPYIVSRLACFASLSLVIREVKDEWRVAMTTAALAHYNPTTVQGRDLAEPLKALFFETREAYKANVQDVGIANQRHRLERLQRLADKAEEDESSRLELEVLKQAREEMARSDKAGDAANSGEGGASDGAKAPAGFKARVDELAQFSPEELAERYTEMLD